MPATVVPGCPACPKCGAEVRGKIWPCCARGVCYDTSLVEMLRAKKRRRKVLHSSSRYPIRRVRTDFPYDNMGRVIGTSTQYAWLPSLNFQNAYSYDAASNRTSLTAPVPASPKSLLCACRADYNQQ